MKKTIKVIGVSVLTLFLIAGLVAFYLFNMPARNVQNEEIDYKLTSSEIVNEYLRNPSQANQKYLQEEGDSKILAVTGTIASISTDQNNQIVVLLMDSIENAGVSCTFIESTNKNALNLRVGQNVTIKGVIRSGAGFDKDLNLYEDVIMEKCDLIIE